MEASEKQGIVDKLKSEHGRIYEVCDEDSPYGLVLVRPLTKLEYRGIKQDREDETLKTMVDEKYATKVIVYPAAAAVQKLFDEYPVLAASILGQVLQISGAENLHSKKL